ncbi:MAG TPA: lanthionine synthetase C family protein [Thermoanaerobaculia bacterium]|nr:lanthionine synthetase C family protein [Thermoanaerobaculia bacterium]
MTGNWHPLLAGPGAERVSAAVHEIAAALASAPLPPEGRGASLAAGQAGQAVFHAYLALAENDEAQADLAAALLDGAVEALATTPLPPMLYVGFPGVAWVAEHLQGRLFEPGEEDPNLDVDEALLGALDRSPWPGDYDLITGLVGLGVYALERLPRPTARALLEKIVERLAERSERMPAGISWFTPPERLPEWQRELHPNGYYNLGVAHGVPAVVAVLAGAAAAGVDRARPLLDDAVRWLLAQRQGPESSSCFSTSFYPGEDPSLSRLAWCYGDPGVAASLLAAARAVGETAWEEEARAIARLAAGRSAETAMVRDAGLCHGAAGVAHLFNRMYQATGEEPLAEAARFWFDHALAIRQPGEGIAGFRVWTAGQDGGPPWRTDPGFLEGTTGIGLALLAAVSSVEPAWDRVLLVSLP